MRGGDSLRSPRAAQRQGQGLEATASAPGNTGKSSCAVGVLMCVSTWGAPLCLCVLSHVHVCVCVQGEGVPCPAAGSVLGPQTAPTPGNSPFLVFLLSCPQTQGISLLLCGFLLQGVPQPCASAEGGGNPPGTSAFLLCQKQREILGAAWPRVLAPRILGAVPSSCAGKHDGSC